MEIHERLYNLLPGFYRLRDADNNQVLRALMAIMDAERQRIEEDIGQLYEDQFIETCQPWVIPYIADLLDVSLPATVANRRAYVANTIGYRRRKGVLGTIEELARDITGWPAVGVEFFKRLAATQHVDHPRPDRSGFAQVRDQSAMLRNGGPFEQAPRTAEVRLVDTGRGKYGVPNLGVFLWPVRDYPIAGISPQPVPPDELDFAPAADEERFWLHPAGEDMPLINPTDSKRERNRVTDERDVPTRLRNRPLHFELEERRAGSFDGKPGYFRRGARAVEVRIGGERVPVDRVHICDLTTWQRPDIAPPAADTAADSGGGDSASMSEAEAIVRDARVVVDVELGRLLVLSEADWQRDFDIRVDYAYGALADMGGGPYERAGSVARWLDAEDAVDWQCGVTVDPDVLSDKPAEPVVDSLEAALQLWEEHVGQEPHDAEGGAIFGVIAIMDSASYRVSAEPGDGTEDQPQRGMLEVRLGDGHRLAIVAADWPEHTLDDGTRRRFKGDLVPNDVRPYIEADLHVSCLTLDEDDAARPTELILDGLLVDGAVDIGPNGLDELRVFDTTLVPEAGGVRGREADTEDSDSERRPASVSGPESYLTVELRRSICGPIDLGQIRGQCQLAYSVVVAGQQAAIAAERAHLTARRTTILGRTVVERVEADDTIFEDPLRAARRQDGCVRFSYVPQGSQTPRQYRCQPRLAFEAWRAEHASLSDEQLQEHEQLIARRLAPSFVSRRWWMPQFAQLDQACAPELSTGAEDGAQMGVYNRLQHPQRLASLRAAVAEYLPVGMYAGFFFAT